MSPSPAPVARRRYDVLIAGARCAGAATAMLTARAGLKVLAVDPAARGRDTLSTHALMRGAILQLHRWGLLDAVRATDAPPIESTTFHYRDETVTVPIKARDGVDALFAPRRTVLDPILIDAATAAGAEIVHGMSVVDLLRDAGGRVRGATVAGADRRVLEIEADLVIGADGIHSRVARLLNAPVDYAAGHAAASLFGYCTGLGLDGYHWYYEVGASVGTIPTNAGETCVFALLPAAAFAAERHRGLEAVYRDTLTKASPALARRVAGSDGPGKLRAFAGEPGFLRRSAGPGWALVGDAGYFRDPITAHGITDALRDAEFLSRAVVAPDDDALAGYQAARDERVRGLLDVTDRLASFEWTLEEARDNHLALSREMKALVKAIGSFS